MALLHLSTVVIAEIEECGQVALGRVRVLDLLGLLGTSLGSGLGALLGDSLASLLGGLGSLGGLGLLDLGDGGLSETFRLLASAGRL